MKLYLLRHGIAEDGRPGQSDAERRLTSKGRQQLEASGLALARLQLRPAAIVSSPLLRARETAEIVAGALGTYDTLPQSEALLPSAEPEQTRELIASYGEAAELLLVGHEPHMSGLALWLCDAAPGNLLFKKGGLCRIDLPAADRAGALVWLLPPKALVLLGS